MITVGNTIQKNPYNNTTFKSKKPPKMITVKAHSSIDKYYEQELKMIQQQKKERALIEKLDPALIFEKIKNKILVNTKGS